MVIESGLGAPTGAERRAFAGTFTSSSPAPAGSDSFLMPTMTGLGQGMNAASQLYAGFAALEIADFNVEQIGFQIEQLGIQTELNLNQFKREARNLIGKQTVAAATTGLQMSGSIVDIMTDTMTQLELKRLDIKRQADLQEYALRVKQEIIKTEAENQFKAAIIGAAGSVFSAFAPV